MEWLKNGLGKRNLLLVGVVVVSLCVSLLGGTVGLRDSQGTPELVLTIGNPAYAAGSPDYICDGIADDVQFQAAMNALPATGGKLVVLTGTYVFSATVTRAIDNVSCYSTTRYARVVTGRDALDVESHYWDW